MLETVSLCRGLSHHAGPERTLFSRGETGSSGQEVCWTGKEAAEVFSVACWKYLYCFWHWVFKIHSKYLSLCSQAALRRCDVQRLSALQQKLSVVLEERQQLQAEYRSSIAARSKLESLCREQQSFYNVLRVWRMFAFTLAQQEKLLRHNF